ncbi:MAG: hypothetical protein IIC23_05375 [Chloroflexi bacterium]|nr:hypothetical protein [Chloroflexota bacterium]
MTEAPASEVGAAGVNLARSGTVIGMLFDDDGRRRRYAASLAWNWAEEMIPGLKAVDCGRVIGGGVSARRIGPLKR